MVECRNCGRRFVSDRIGVHERICKGLKHGPPPAPGATTKGATGGGAGSDDEDSRPVINSKTTTKVSPFDSLYS